MSKVQRFSLGIILALIPLIVLTVSVRVLASANVCDKHVFLTDEISHWAQAATFAEAGFDGGFYTVNEINPPLERIRFYFWGPTAPIIYGSVGRIFGLSFCTPLYTNLVVLGFAIALFVMTIKVAWRQAVLLGILLATFPPLVVYAPTVMLQVLNIAIAALIASMFYRIATREKFSPSDLILATIVILLASTLRVMWSFLLLPLFIIFALDRFTWQRLILGVVFALSLSLAAMLLFISVSAPFPNVFSASMERLSANVFDGLRAFAANIRRNMFRTIQGNVAHLVLRLQMLIISVFASHTFYTQIRMKKWQESSLRFAIIHLVNLAMIFMFVLVTYDMYDWRDYRVFAPHLFLSLLLLIAEGRYKLVMGLLSLSLLSYTAIMPLYSHTVSIHFGSERAYTQELEGIANEIHSAGIEFNPDAPSPWCNTILFTLNFAYEPSILLAFDDAMGLSLIYLTPILEERPQSRYLLLNDEIVIPETLDLIPLLSVPEGQIYLNPYSACDENDD